MRLRGEVGVASSWSLLLLLACSCFGGPKLLGRAQESGGGQQLGRNRTARERTWPSQLDQKPGDVWAPQYHEVYSSNPDQSCKEDPDQTKCCPVEDRSPCLITIIRPSDGCTPACRKRYATLGYKCWKRFHKHFQWQQAARNCDPESRVVFEPDASEDLEAEGEVQLLPSSLNEAEQEEESGSSSDGSWDEVASKGSQQAKQNGELGLLSQLSQRRFWDMMIGTCGATALLTLVAAGGATFLFTSPMPASRSSSSLPQHPPKSHDI